MKIPLLDLSRQYRSVRGEVLREVKRVCDSGHYILGPNVAALEEEIAAYSGAAHAIGVASGSDALILSLMAAGVGQGDRVVTTPFTFFATAGSIVRLGAVPVFVDIEPDTYNIDPGSLEERLGRDPKGVKAVIAVHLYGQSADMAPILSTSRKYGLRVVEDAAQSIGAVYRGRRAGSIGDFGCFSFYPTKNLGAMGDGGMITTKSARAAAFLRRLRVHGARARYYHDVVGVNSRLDELQAAVLRVKLKKLDTWTEARIRNANLYTSLIEKAGLGGLVKTPYVQEGNISVYNQYVVAVKYRTRLREHLASMGVGTEIYYPLPLHLQKCFRDLGYRRGDLPVSEKAAREVLALPVFPELKKSEIRYVVSAIKGFYERAG